VVIENSQHHGSMKCAGLQVEAPGRRLCRSYGGHYFSIYRQWRGISTYHFPVWLAHPSRREGGSREEAIFLAGPLPDFVSIADWPRVWPRTNYPLHLQSSVATPGRGSFYRHFLAEDASCFGVMKKVPSILMNKGW